MHPLRQLPLATAAAGCLALSPVRAHGRPDSAQFASSALKTAPADGATLGKGTPVIKTIGFSAHA